MSTEDLTGEVRWVALGIDPGLKGGVAALGHQGGDREVAVACAMPVRKTGKGSKQVVDAAALHRLLLRFAPAGRPKPLTAVEKVSGMRKGEKGRTQGVASTFTFGLGYGKVLGVIEVMGLPLVEPTPQVWQKLVLKGRAGGKDASIAYCLARHPDVSLLPTSRSKKESHGLSDALCLAEYALRQRIRKEDGEVASAGVA